LWAAQHLYSIEVEQPEGRHCDPVEIDAVHINADRIDESVIGRVVAQSANRNLGIARIGKKETGGWHLVLQLLNIGDPGGLELLPADHRHRPRDILGACLLARSGNRDLLRRRRGPARIADITAGQHRRIGGDGYISQCQNAVGCYGRGDAGCGRDVGGGNCGLGS
jgi:hypothetical protein